MNFTVRLYERDEHGRFWPEGQYTFDTRSKAVTSLKGYIADGHSGIVTTPEKLVTFGGMSQSEALRVSPVKVIEV